MKSRAIEKDEWRFVGTVIVFVLVITSLPYLYAYISTPPDKHFMGIMLDVPDHVQYFWWMRELTTANVIPNKLTPEANDPIFFNLLWWLLARVSKPLGLGLPERCRLCALRPPLCSSSSPTGCAPGFLLTDKCAGQLSSWQPLHPALAGCWCC